MTATLTETLPQEDQAPTDSEDVAHLVCERCYDVHNISIGEVTIAVCGHIELFEGWMPAGTPTCKKCHHGICPVCGNEVW